MAASPIEQYIRAAAHQRGIDPEIAVRVARSEGGLSDPFRQSDVVKNGVREQSYGPFQLYMGGGLGNEALKAGIDPQKDWQGGIDFALDKAKQGGWGPWYGAAKVGIGPRDGIGMASQIAAQQPSPPQASGSPAPPLPAPRTISDMPIGSMAPSPAPQMAQAPQIPSDQLMSVLGSMVPQSQAPQFQPVQIQGPSPEQATALSDFIQALKSRIQGAA
jgi:hypothetical protein